MDAQGSVSRWLDPLRAGDSAAVQHLWERYFHRLVGLARARLQGFPRRAADEEDVALSAFDSFCRAAEQGRFPQLHDRDDLWQLLLVLTDRKACDLAHHERRDRRGGGRVVDATALARGSESTEEAPRHEVRSPEPSPEFAALAAEEFRRLLDMLGDDDLRRVAVRRMEGYSVAEVAAQLGRVPRTVKRWLRLIRQTWEQELAP